MGRVGSSQEGQKTLDRESAAALVRIVLGGVNVHAAQVRHVGGSVRQQGCGLMAPARAAVRGVSRLYGDREAREP